MGFRYRKTINLGGGFRVNISKSGVSYSWGVKGYRITKTAKGNIRKTASIPGTGISYVEESSRKKDQVTTTTPNLYNTEEIANKDAAAMVSNGLEEILTAARKTIIANQISTFGIVIFLLFSAVAPIFLFLCLASVLLKVYARTIGRIDMEYIIDEDQSATIQQRTAPLLHTIVSQKLWRIVQTSKVVDRKYTGGAGNLIKRVSCQASQNAPFPFKSNMTAVSYKSGKETLVFFPDKLFIIQGNKIGALSYNDITISTSTTRFIESGNVPKDAKIVDYTWQYINKTGGPDKRFKNNRHLPVCLYGELTLQSALGLNTIIMFSNITPKS